jgi:hypothetical protein
MTQLRSVCVFCGSRPGADSAHADEARALHRRTHELERAWSARTIDQARAANDRRWAEASQPDEPASAPAAHAPGADRAS